MIISLELVNKGILDERAEWEACTYHLWKHRPVIQSGQLRVVLFKWGCNSSPFRVCKFWNSTRRTTAHCPPCRHCFCEIDENPQSASNCPSVGCTLVVAWFLVLNTVWAWTLHSGRCGFKSWVHHCRCDVCNSFTGIICASVFFSVKWVIVGTEWEKLFKALSMDWHKTSTQ